MIGYSDWMRRTSVFGARRSDKLVKVDAALKAYGAPGGATDANLRTLKAAFEAWKLSKGVDWRKSDRNKNKACDQLEATLHGGLGTSAGITAAELQALKEIERANAMNLDRMFRSRKLRWKPAASAKNLGATRSALGRFRLVSDEVVAGATGEKTSDHLRSGTSQLIGAARGAVASGAPSPGLVSGALANARAVVMQLLTTLFDELNLQKVVDVLGTLVNDIVETITPFVGMVSGGVKAVLGWAKVAKQLFKRSGFANARIAFAPGDPEAAFDAVMVMIDRELIQTVRKATTETVATISQAAFTLVDFGAVSGAVIGAAKALSNLVAQIYLLARDYREMKAANQLLRVGALNLDLFKVNPLLGCYLVACSDTSALVNMAVSGYGKPGWKMEVEDLVRKADPLRIKASQFMRSSHFEIPELANSAGAYRFKLDKTLSAPTGKSDRAVDKHRLGFLVRS